MPSYFLSRKPKPAVYGINSPANDSEMATITNENIPVFHTEIQVPSLPWIITYILTFLDH